MKYDPRDLAEKWLVTPGADQAMGIVGKLRDNKADIPLAAKIAAEGVIVTFLVGWLEAWAGEEAATVEFSRKVYDGVLAIKGIRPL